MDRPGPTREQLEDRLGHDPDAIGLLFEWSMAELMERYLTDERMQIAYMGQGVVGTFASPYDPGTASIYFHHYCGRLDGGEPGGWGYVTGGMGTVSFLIHDAAIEAGAVVAAGVPVSRILPGEGVELAGGDRIQAPVVVSNADPVVTSRLLGDSADAGWRRRIEAVPMRSCTVKVNAALAELPNFKARPGTRMPHHLATINTPLTKAEWKECYADAVAGRLPKRLWTEIYLQTAYDPSVAPPGRHVMSVFSQYVPHTFAQGDWDTHRARRASWWSIRSAASAATSLRRSSTWKPGSTRRGGQGGANGGTHLPGRVPAAVHVEQSSRIPHADERGVPLRRLHPSRRERDRDQRAERGDGGAGEAVDGDGRWEGDGRRETGGGKLKVS
jgi:phytoene dehydrogenase-like protein